MFYVKELSTNKECEYNPGTNIVKIISKDLMMPSGHSTKEIDYFSNKEFFSRPYRA